MELERRGSEDEESMIDLRRRERETNEEREARFCKRNLIYNLHLYRLARHREYDRNRRAAMTISEREENLSRRMSMVD